MSNLCRAFILMILLIGTGVLIAGDEGRWNFQTVKAKTAAVRYEQAIQAAKATYQRTVTDTQRQFIADLDEAKVDATKAGNLDEAIRLRDAIQSLHKTMPDVENDNTPHPTGGNPISAMIGDWNYQWGTTGNKGSFTVTEKGEMIWGRDKYQLTRHDGRVLNRSTSIKENVELIPANGRLIVLAWTRGRRDILKDQPNHVGIATRAE